MMRKGGESPEEEKERFKVSRGFAKRVKEILGDAPDIVFEHVGQATFPTSVLVVKPFGKVVSAARPPATPRLRRPLPVDAPEGDPRLALRQRVRVLRANQLMAEGKIRPGPVAGDGLRGVPEAHQLLHENKHLAKISIDGRGHGRGAGQAGGGARGDLGEVGT